MEGTTPFRFNKQSSTVSYARLIVSGMLCLLLPHVSLSITCSSGYVASGTKCYTCSSFIGGCNTCTSTTSCTSCSTGYYRSATGSSCYSCYTGCATCTSTSASSCTSCISGYTLKSTSCEYTATTSGSGSSTGGIVGGVVGGAVLVGILVAIYCCCKKKQTLAQQQNPQGLAQMLGARTPGGGQSLVMGNTTQMGGYPGQPGGFSGGPSFNPYSQPPGINGPGLQPLQPVPGYAPAQPYNPPVPIAQVGSLAGGFSNPQPNAWQGQNDMGFEQQRIGGQMGPNQNNAALPPGFT